MRLFVAALAAFALLGVGACRHVVVERDFGRVDGARSITTNSDLEWTIQHEPDPERGVAPRSD